MSKKPFHERKFGKFLAKKGTQRVIHGIIGEVPFVGRGLAGILTPTPEGKFNFQPDWKRTGITLGLGAVIAILINKGIITQEGLKGVVDVIIEVLGATS